MLAGTVALLLHYWMGLVRAMRLPWRIAAASSRPFAGQST
jgi:hypothetical protein